MKTFDEYIKQTAEIGYVESIVSPLFYISGLPTIRPYEIVITEGGTRGVVQIVYPDLAECLTLESKNLTHQERVARTLSQVTIELSEGLLGRIVNPFGVPMDGLGPIAGEKVVWNIDRPVPGIMERVKISEPMETGVTVVDLLVQIGKGQKELVAGDQKTGKTTFVLQALGRQAQQGTICVYACVGKRKGDLKYALDHLALTGALKNTVVIAATSADPSSHVFFAPFAAFTVAEYFRGQGRDVLVVLDDMTTHARYYREIALVARKTPGRSSYPGDIFHLQARLLERTGRIKLKDGKAVSITTLPIAETQEGDLTGYIQTNLMAMTDGHIFFDINEFKRGRLPAVNSSLSVTRVGNQTQSMLEKELRGWLDLRLNEYNRLRETMSFGIEVPAEYEIIMQLGQKIELLFDQDPKTIVPKELQTILLGLLFNKFFDEKDMAQTKEAKNNLIEAYNTEKLGIVMKDLPKVTNLKGLEAHLVKYAATFSKITWQSTAKSN